MGRTTFSLTLLPKGGQHEDLELRCGPLFHVVDSYYLALDTEIDPGNESRGKVRRVLAELLRGVRERLARARKPSVLLFPYDFSDEYIGLLELAVDAQDRVAIRPVYSTQVQGWAVVVATAWKLPSSTWGTLTAQPGEEKREPPLVMPRADLLADLDASALLAAPTPRRRVHHR